jgi:hypothetical protein
VNDGTRIEGCVLVTALFLVDVVPKVEKSEIIYDDVTLMKQNLKASYDT